MTGMTGDSDDDHHQHVGGRCARAQFVSKVSVECSCHKSTQVTNLRKVQSREIKDLLALAADTAAESASWLEGKTLLKLL